MKTLGVEVELTKDDNFRIAQFAAVVPEKPKAAIVLVPGSNGDGRYLTGISTWKNLAIKHDAAIVGCYLQDHEFSSVEGYADARKGSGAALLTALDKLNLSKIPILMWGFSAGGQFAYEFTCWLSEKQPDRVKAFVANKGGVYYTALAPKGARETPGIFFIGNKDAEFRQAILHGIFSLNHAVGCFWKEHREDVGHIIGASEDVSVKFFDHILKDL